MTTKLRILDARLFWAFRFLVYKFLLGKLKGVGYIGRPTFKKGLKNLYVDAGFGLFPGWRIEILDGKVVIGSNFRAGQNLFINCGSEVVIGDDVTVSANVFIGTSNHIISKGDISPFSDWQIEEKPVSIGDNCFIGYGAVILPGAVLEKGCVVGANSVVKGHYKAGTIIAPPKSQAVRSRL